MNIRKPFGVGLALAATPPGSVEKRPYTLLNRHGLVRFGAFAVVFSSLFLTSPASAQIAMVLPFYGDLSVWVRSPDAGGWHFPTSARRSGETILEVARRELWDSARIVASRLDLLGAIRYELPRPTTAYVYMCEVQQLTWWYDIPDKEKSAEIGVFTGLPRPVASEAVEVVLEAALRARRTGLR